MLQSQSSIVPQTSSYLSISIGLPLRTTVDAYDALMTKPEEYFYMFSKSGTSYTTTVDDTTVTFDVPPETPSPATDTIYNVTMSTSISRESRPEFGTNTQYTLRHCVTSSFDAISYVLLDLHKQYLLQSHTSLAAKIYMVGLLPTATGYDIIVIMEQLGTKVKVRSFNTIQFMQLLKQLHNELTRVNNATIAFMYKNYNPQSVYVTSSGVLKLVDFENASVRINDKVVGTPVFYDNPQLNITHEIIQFIAMFYDFETHTNNVELITTLNTLDPLYLHHVPHMLEVLNIQTRTNPHQFGTFENIVDLINLEEIPPTYITLTNRFNPFMGLEGQGEFLKGVSFVVSNEDFQRMLTPDATIITQTATTIIQPETTSHTITTPTTYYLKYIKYYNKLHLLS